MLKRGVTQAIVNSAFTPSADFIDDGDQDFEINAWCSRLSEGTGGCTWIDATGVAADTLGDAIFANMIMLGAAWQAKRIPIGLAALNEAIRLNGVAVEEFRIAFDLGRLAVHDRSRFDALTSRGSAAMAGVRDDDVEALIEHRAAFLNDYQNAAYATRYRRTVDRVAARDRAFPDKRQALTRAVAQSLFQLMAYKDEYEVARLHTHTGFLDRLSDAHGEGGRVYFHMAPPILSRRDPATGAPRKTRFGPWIIPVLRALAAFRKHRGGPLDLFGRTEERRWERGLIASFEADLASLVPSLDAERYDEVTAFARAPLGVKGYGYVKRRRHERVAAEQAVLKARILGDHVRAPATST